MQIIQKPFKGNVLKMTRKRPRSIKFVQFRRFYDSHFKTFGSRNDPPLLELGTSDFKELVKLEYVSVIKYSEKYSVKNNDERTHVLEQ